MQEQEGRNIRRLIAGFDALVAALFVMILVGNVEEVRSPAPDATADDAHINLADCALDGVVLVSAVGAMLCLLLERRQAASLQRVMFWGLLLRDGFLFGESMLPFAGLAGLGQFVAGVLLLALVGLALWSSAHLHKAEQRTA